MKKILALFRRFFKRHTAEMEALLYNKEVREAIQRKNEVTYWIFDFIRSGQLNR